MKHKQGLIIDNFAGGGGASTGIEQAMGRPVDIAINHDLKAIEMHQMNHPDTKHYCESVWDIDPVAVTEGKKVDLLWASPDCKHFSKAKGAVPVKKEIRGLAWVVIRWALLAPPNIMFLENVEEFRTWGPVKNGKIDTDKKGVIYESFKRMLSTGIERNNIGFRQCCKALKIKTNSALADRLVEGLGYNVEDRIITACDHGAPTKRKRLFLIARRDGKQVVWPKATHGDPESEEVRVGILKPWRTAAEIINWKDLGNSIFNRKKPLAENTMRRIARGIQKFVLDNPDPFILNDEVTLTLLVNTSGHPGSAVNEPLRTITSGGHHALISPYLARIGQTGFGKDALTYSMKKPLTTITMKAEHLLIAPVMIQMGYGDSEGRRVLDLFKPIGTITSGGNKFAIGAAFLTEYGEKHQSNNQQANDNSNQVHAFLMKYYGADIGQAVNIPLHTVTGKARFALITIKGTLYRIVDIKMRMLQPRELFAAQGFPEEYVIEHDAYGKKISKSEQIAKCGNSVSPHPAEAIVRANCSDIALPGRINYQDALFPPVERIG
ncbi:putative cytosine-specific modification methylase [Listeria riparia FSL S10-1204]|uniref:DNA (cytosine-5-)-methyltransferase n=2 Tax=Listeria riparia TaxID=1494964 RepID=W7D4S6_9LIST|nr:putative cytosine-specific modification methylase [Listeria riparia FSL S10-1204]